MFSIEWLALREPADAAARSAALTRSLAGILPREGTIRVLDLASGTGANARYLAPRLGDFEQDWLLADHDPALLAAVQVQAKPDSLGRERIRVTTRRTDLSTFEDAALFQSRHLVTASALLDLVSEAWLRRLAGLCSDAHASVLFALTYSGRIECDPLDSDDGTIRELVNMHQRTDKGFGPALGPTAVEVAARLLTESGYQVRREHSDWKLSPAAGELQRQLIEGWAAAAREIDERSSDRIDRWRERRVALVNRKTSSIIVGHEDMLAVRRD